MEQFLRSRRSVRQFKDKGVEKATLQNLIMIARYSPTAGNSQLVEWLVVDDRRRLQDIAAQVIGWMRTLLQDQKSAGHALLSGYRQGLGGWIRFGTSFRPLSRAGHGKGVLAHSHG